ncbi:hypothetical protein, partial [Nocardia brasiliensis]|uniref:hypothetical protein n=1 Tax=Nocardia brasiliensis TaxID=37326 RepID=UPI002457C490
MTVEPHPGAELVTKDAASQRNPVIVSGGQDARPLRLVPADAIGAADTAVRRYLAAAEADDTDGNAAPLRLVPAASSG